jgi:hypothetical protein
METPIEEQLSTQSAPTEAWARELPDTDQSHVLQKYCPAETSSRVEAVSRLPIKGCVDRPIPVKRKEQAPYKEQMSKGFGTAQDKEIRHKNEGVENENYKVG